MSLEGNLPSVASELKNKIVRAGAGAGKTYQLVEAVVRFCLDFWDQNGRDPKLILTTFTRKSTQELRERLLRRACELAHPALMDLFASRSLIRISTIHGVLAQFLREYGSLVGYEPAFEIIDETSALQLAREILRETLTEADRGVLRTYGFNGLLPYLRSLSALLIVNPTARPVGESELNATFSNRKNYFLLSMRKVLTALEDFCQTEPMREWVLAQQAKFDSDTLDFESLPRAKDWKAVDKEVRDSYKQTREELQDFLEHEAHDPKTFKDQSTVHAELADLAARFTAMFSERKRQSGQFELSDLENLTARILDDHPELGESFAKDWDYWLIDEYQDTSPLQVKILERLVGEKKSFVVGDPQQSIYLFRGADAEIFHARLQTVARENGDVCELKTSYRSIAPLVNFINASMQKTQQEFLQLEPRSSTNPKQSVGYFYIGEENSPGRINEAVIHHLHKLLAQGARVGSIAILSAKNKELREIARTLRQWQFPYQLHSPGGFNLRREVQDLKALLKFFINPHDNMNLISLLRSPWFGVDDALLVQAVEKVEGHSYFRSFLNLSEMATASGFQMLSKLRELSLELGVFEALLKGLNDSGWLDDARIFDPSGRMESNIWKFVDRLRQFERSGRTNILEFLQMDSAEIDPDEADTDGDAVSALEPDRVQLMTIHASKGLEFEHVLLLNLHNPYEVKRPNQLIFDQKKNHWMVPVPVGEDQGLKLPVSRLEYFEELERRERSERERQFYVAITRAKQSVALFWRQDLAARNASRSPWCQFYDDWNLNVGIHENTNFVYEVTQSPFSQDFYQAAKSEKIMLSRFLQTEQPAVRKRVSVSERLGQSERGPTEKKEIPSGQLVWNRLRAAIRGTDFHRQMENLRYSNLAIPADLNPTTQDQLQWTLGLKTPPMEQLLRHGEVEWGFQLLDPSGEIIEGQIDLWGIVDGMVHVVDYKTGDPDTEKAFEQLEMYARALRVMHPGIPVSLHILIADSKRVVTNKDHTSANSISKQTEFGPENSLT